MYLPPRNVFYKRQRLKRVSDPDTKCRGPGTEETKYHVCNKQVSRKRSNIKKKNYIHALIYIFYY